MPITRSRGKPLILYAACAMASSGFETMIRMQLGECFTTLPTTSFMIL